MIYGRWGNVVEVVRAAVLADVKRLDKREPDAQDRKALKSGSYVVVRNVDNGSEQLYHLAYLRADNGSVEIGAALSAAGRLTD